MKSLDWFHKLTGRVFPFPPILLKAAVEAARKNTNINIEISLGSSFEPETQLMIAKELKYGDQVLLAENLAQLSETQKMLYAFARVLSAEK